MTILGEEEQTEKREEVHLPVEQEQETGFINNIEVKQMVRMLCYSVNSIAGPECFCYDQCFGTSFGETSVNSKIHK